MSTIKQEGKRYQNPQLFEQLAMEYAIGMLHGRARIRFESLMEKHLYLRATTEAYEQKFALLADLLPEENPHPRVWRKVKEKIAKDKSKEGAELDNKAVPWWRSVRMKMTGLAATVFLVTSTMFMLNPNSTIAYSAMLESDAHEMMAVATVKKGEDIHVELIKNVTMPDNMQLALWCISKDTGEMHARMGVLNKSGKSVIKADKAKWDHLADVGAFAVVLESTVGGQVGMDDVISRGGLNSISESGE